ncbi:extracellular solute-binding protein [Aureibacillus halotolerans]|uniref:Iron(III) transport system substrate-binding protein n=1 Tax=Aureibacillus halotolerans TaxID=1508390 RepID=A0A4R6TUB5_9BACI|nr:extracellular solute-binding protein [Aureibacillus halotolerans]TDQ33783.1 iron(III) transport system substrate-binding protein [Aureibacillus halotolerans]
MNIKKSLSKGLVAASSLLLLMGCASGGTSNGEATASGSAEGGSSESGSSEALVVYTNSDSNGRGDWLIEQAAEAGFAIELVAAGGGDVTNRLVSEKANPIADVVFGLNHMFYEQLKNEDILISYEPAWAGEIEEGINDSEGYYHGLVKQALIMAYNLEFVAEADAPESYLDVVNDEQYQGLYQARDDLGAGTAKVIVASILTQFQDPEGELGVSEEGWAFIDRFYENGVQIPEGENHFVALASGDAPIGTIISGVVEASMEQYGADMAYIHPEIGTPQVVEGVAIVNGTEHEEQAKEFVDWMGSAEVQGEFAAEFNAMPANEEAKEQVTDFQKQLFEGLESQQIDWAFVTEHMDAWVEKLELEIF